MTLGDAAASAPAASAPAAGTPAAAPATPAPAAVAAPATPPAAIGTGAAAPAASWRDGLSDDLKADPTLNKYSDIPNLAKAHVELQKLIGQKGIIKPGKDASPEAIKSFREALGIPSDPTKYDLGTFEGAKVPPETIAWAQKMGAEHGIEPAAMKAVMSEYMKLESSNNTLRQQQTQTEIKTGFEGLRTEWGEAFDRNLSRANFAAQKLGGQPLIDRLKKFGADNDPVILKMFAEAAKLYGEDRLREAGAGDGRQSPQELDAELAQIQGQLLSLPKSDGRRPGILAKWESLNRQRTAGK